MTREEAIMYWEDFLGEIDQIEVDDCWTNEDAETQREATKMAISALRKQECVGDANKALTLDELRQMDGEPVWTITAGLKGSGRWEIVRDVDEYMIEMCNCSDGIYCIDVDTYGKTWLAYRQKPEEENRHG